MEKKTKPKDFSVEDEKKDLQKDRPEKAAHENGEKSYYYDDAHGYEIFVEENEEDEDD